MSRSRRHSPETRSLLAFGAKWSPPWPLLVKALTALAADGVEVSFVDVDADPSAAERHRIVCVPTVVVMAGGGERRRVTGAISAADLGALVRR